MKTIDIKGASLQTCVQQASDDRVLLTEHGRPVAMMVAVDAEDVSNANDPELWRTLAGRRSSPTIDRAGLDHRLGIAD